MTLSEWKKAVAEGGLVEIERKRGKMIVYAFPSGEKIAEIRR